jgi:hypothetical protein
VDSDSPVQANGVNPGEALELYLALATGRSFQEAIASLNGGGLRIGIHVQGFEGGGSESFINVPADGNDPVPEPGTLLLLASGVLGLAGGVWCRRRKERTAHAA